MVPMYIYELINPNDFVTMRLVCAKSRIAPILYDKIPRLELIGAVLLARLIMVVQNSLSTFINDVCLWSDSTIVLSWLSKPASHWKQFVSNHIREIQETISFAIWRHVKCTDNPADAASSGVPADKMPNFNLRWNGPSFLHRSIEIPKATEFVDKGAMEKARRPKIHAYLIDIKNHPLQNLIQTFICVEYFSNNCVLLEIYI